MLSRLQINYRRGAFLGCVVGILLVFQGAAGLAAPAAGVLLDFKDDAQFTQIRVTAQTKIEPANEAYQGQRAASITFAAVPEGVREYPAAIIEGPGLRVHDFSAFETISLWVKNPGLDDADLSLAVWDKDGNRSFPIPSTVTIKPGRWEQVAARLVLDGLDAKQIGSVHLYQKMNRKPVTLLIADVELLSPFAARLAGRIQGARQALNTARGNAVALGAKDQLEPKIAELTRRLDDLENSAASASTASAASQRLLEVAQISVEAQDLSKAIQISNGGKKIILSGPLVQAVWLSNPEKLKPVTEFVLSNTTLGDEVFPLLAPAKDLEVLTLDSRKITGAGIDKLTSEKLRGLVLSFTGANDDGLKGIGKFSKLHSIQLDGTGVTSGVFKHFEALKQLKTLSLAETQVSDTGFEAIAKVTSLESLNLKLTRIHGKAVRQLASLTKLKVLDLGDTQLDDSDLSQFGALTQLESLSLENAPITGAAFGKLRGLDKLVELNLNRTRVGDSAIRLLGKLPRLTRLELSGTRVSDGGLSQILESAPLKYVDLFGTNITDATMAGFQKKNDLYSLFVGGTQVTDVGLSYLQKLNGLQHLDLEGTQITDAGLQYLQGRRLFDLRVGKTRLSGDGLKYLANTRGLLFLDLSGTSVTDESLTAFAKLDHLLTLNLNGSRVTSKGMRKLQGCGQLKELQLEATQVGDEGLELLASLQSLQRLNLNESAVTNAGLKHLKAYKRLVDLSLSGTQITDDGVAELGEKYTSLDLSHTRITNQGIEQLARCGQLTNLRLASTGITNNGLKLLQALPALAHLDVAGTVIDDQGLQSLSLLPQLREVNLDGTSVSDRGIDTILKLSSLQRVSLENARVSAQGVSYLRHSAPKLSVALVFPFVWGEGWSRYSAAGALAPSTGAEQAPANKEVKPQAAFLQQLKDLSSLRSLHVDDSLLTPKAMKSLKDLPTLEHLSFQRTAVTDDMLADLLGMSQVASLDFSDTRLTDQGLEHIKDIAALRELNLAGTKITGAGFTYLASLTRLQTLNLRGTPVDDAGMANLARLKELRKLELSGTQVTDAGIEHLAQLPRLQYLDLYGTEVTDRGMMTLSRQKGLRYVYLSNTRITDAGIEQLRGLTELEELALDGTQLTDQGLARLAPLINLSTIRISHTKVTEAGLSNLAPMSHIERLELAGLPVTNAYLPAIQKMARLKALDLSGTKINDDALVMLAKCPSLVELNVRDTTVSAAGIAGFQKVHPDISLITGTSYLKVNESSLTREYLRSLKDVPGLEHLSFQGTSIADDMLGELSGLSQVTRLDLSNTRVTDEGLEHLKDMQGLRELSLAGTKVNGAGFTHLANLTRLQALNLRNTALDDAGAAHLAGLKDLRKLELSDTHITDAGIAGLAQLPHLQYIDLTGCSVTDIGLASLGRQMELRYCYLTNTRITDAGIEHLSALTGLEELGIDSTRLTDKGLASLAPLTNLSTLRISHTKVTEAGLLHLAPMSRIDRLEVAGLPVTNAGLESIGKMSKLKSLDLSGTKIDDAALTTVAKFPLLSNLNVGDTALTPGAIASFQAAHPGVNVISGKTATHYSPWALVIAILYIIAACAICFYGSHRYWLTLRLLMNRKARKSAEPTSLFAELPRVTVQLPMFNERHVAERIIEAVCAMDYPRDRLQIQVLDDSTDDSANIARRCCERMTAAGHPVEYLHRSNREGFKSGALAAGLKTAAGEFIVIFDADFLPDPNFLRQTIHHFTNPKVGVVQTEWSHLNRGESWLTEMQAMFLDGHFVVEQTVRNSLGRWLNFNGTAGVWRKSCIDEAGGWQHDTLTEDTDLSYRAQLAGWKILYLPTVHCNAELPSTMTAFLGQQHRWTKGLIQTAKKLLPRILLSRVPVKIKLEAWFHLTTPIMYLIMFMVTAIALPALFLATPFTDRTTFALAVGMMTLVLGTCGAATFYIISQSVQGLSAWRALLKIPFLMALGVGISAVNARAVLEALLGFRSPFVRTPKFGARGDYVPDQTTARRPLRLFSGLTELLIAGVLLGCFVLAFMRPFTLIGAPFLLLFALGYSAVGILRLMDQYAMRSTHIRSAASPWRRLSPARFATGVAGGLLLAGIAIAVFRLAPPIRADRHTYAAMAPLFDTAQSMREPVALGLDLTTANWRAEHTGQSASRPTGAIRSVQVERGSLILGIELDEQTHEGAVVLNLKDAMTALGNSLGHERELAFDVQYSSRFTGEFQAFVKDGKGRSEYGSMHIVESHDIPRPVTVALVPNLRCPAMGYQDKGFDPDSGIREVGFKISAQSDRVSGAGYRPFRGTIRIAGVQIADIDRAANPKPEVRPPEHDRKALPIPSAADFLAASGVDRPWPLGYAFSGPVTPPLAQELERTYAAIAAQGCRFTRVYVGDYRTGLAFDANGKVTGVEPEFLDYLDQLAATANRHGITVMFSLTDNAMVNGGRTDSLALLRPGEASDAFVNHGLAEFVKKLQGRQVIWDIFNEPENVTTMPLRDVQRYVDRVLAAGRRADPHARFTVVSRSRPEIIYWQGRGLDLYSHNLFTDRSLEESLAEPRNLEAPIMVAEMAPNLASRKNLDALRNAGYAGIGIWGWGTRDKYAWPEGDLERIVQPLAGKSLAKE